MTNILALADVSKLIAHYESREEEAWAHEGTLWVQSVLGYGIAVSFYHPLTFHLAGESYTPDWMCIFTDGQIAFFEIKGSKKQKGYRDARSKLRAAAMLFPFFAYFEVVVKLERGKIAECSIEAISESM